MFVICMWPFCVKKVYFSPIADFLIFQETDCKRKLTMCISFILCNCSSFTPASRKLATLTGYFSAIHSAASIFVWTASDNKGLQKMYVKHFFFLLTSSYLTIKVVSQRQKHLVWPLEGVAHRSVSGDIFSFWSLHVGKLSLPLLLVCGVKGTSSSISVGSIMRPWGKRETFISATEKMT